jgi:transposase-like protein
VNSHKNARLSSARRVELVQRAAAPSANHTDLGRAFGVCRQTVRKWLARYQADGLAGLGYRSSRPRHSPTRLRRTPRRQIERRRRARHSPRIARELGLPLATVVREQRRLGLNRLSRLEPPRPAHRYEWPAAGELLHLDIKKLGQIGGRVGHRIHGDRTTGVRGAGWEAVHVAIDDCTRLAYAEVCRRTPKFPHV